MKNDIIVIGCGVAGLSAALRAAQKGANVLLLERARFEERGGNSKYTEAYLRVSNESKISDDFEYMFAKLNSSYYDKSIEQISLYNNNLFYQNVRNYGLTDPKIIAAFAAHIPDTIAWLKKNGVSFLEAKPFSIQEQVSERMTPSGGGEALIEILSDACEKAGVMIKYSTRVETLSLNSNNEINGVYAYKYSKLKKYKSNSVILASGGFQGNLEMMSRYFGKAASLTRPVSPGGLYNKGEGISMALNIGAAPAGQYDAFHAEPIDPRSSKPEALVAILNFGIIVNKFGYRFTDEGINLYELVYEDLSREILKQKDGIAYFIYDSKIDDIPNYQRRIKSDKGPITGKSIYELADKLNIDKFSLYNTIINYNKSVQTGAFNHKVLDGKCTKGIMPKKSNWARTLNENNLYAYPLECANCFTFGGLKISAEANVIDLDDRIIPGLYAAGEVIGLYYGSYVGSTSVLRGIVFGKISGDNASNYCQKKNIKKE